MSVVGAAREISEGRQHAVGADGTRTYTRVFIVETSQATDTEPIVLTAAGLPRRYDYYVTATSQDLAAKCQNITCSQMAGSKTLWRVECEYTTNTRDPEEEEENPLNEPADVQLSFETVQVPVMFYPNQNASDEYGLAPLGFIKNGAGDAFDPPPTYEESRPVITITRNELSLSIANAAYYVNAVNADVWRGLPPRTAKLRNIGATEQTKNGFKYVQVTYEIAIKQESWDLRLLNVGYRYRTAAGANTYLNFAGVNGPYLGLLKADGTIYSATNFDADELLLTYRIHKEVPFGPLGL